MNRFHAPFFIDEKSSFALDRVQSRHLRNVLRLKPGDEIKVFDGKGNEFLCLVQEFESQKSRVFVRVLKQTESASVESALDFSLAITILKGAKFDLVIQKATELGVSKLIPLLSIRSDIKLKNTEKKLERWRKIIIESSKQCGRAKLMQICEPTEFNDFIESAEGTNILFSEKSGGSFKSIEASNKITAVVGPEGGWDDSEIEFAKKNDFQIVTFGGRILRAETAAISVTSILQHTFGDLN